MAYLTVSRPDVAVYIAALQRTSHKPTVGEVKRLNALIRWVKANPQKRVFRRPNSPLSTLVIMSDAGFAAEHASGRSHRGALTMLTPPIDFTKAGNCTVHLLDWSSCVQRRVTRSTYAVQWLREELVSTRLSDLLWVDTRSMSADGLTKGSIDREAIHEGMAGVCKLHQPALSAKLSSNIQVES
eukprot:2897290-Amphidinium_carterae.2